MDAIMSTSNQFFSNLLTHHQLDVETSRDHYQQRYRIHALGFVVVIMIMAYYTYPLSSKSLRNTFISHNTTHDILDLNKDSNFSETAFVSIGMGCPDFQTAYNSAESGSSLPFRSFTLFKGSEYALVELHFTKLWLPSAVSVVLRGIEGYDIEDHVLNLSLIYPSGPNYDHVTSPPMFTKELRIEFYRENNSLHSKEINKSFVDTFKRDSKCFGFALDLYDYVLDENNDPIIATGASICATDNTVNAICCYADNTTRTAYLASRSVARLKISKGLNEWAYCTGWMLGNMGHILTNNHCVSTIIEASSTSVEFMVEDPFCRDDFGECPGDVIALSTELVLTSVNLDYALLKIPIDGAKWAQKYGYLRLKTRAGVVGELLYIPQYPKGRNKRIAIEDDYANKVALLSLNASACGIEGYSYSGDTQTGSSGSPVISLSDHGVVALHHCGKLCANSGIPATAIVTDLYLNGLDVADFDMIDDESTYGANAARFAEYTPSIPEFVQPKSIRLTLDGAITIASGSATIDMVNFTLLKDADISFAVISVEIADNGTFIDLNHDCRATYLDSVLYLFFENSSVPIFFLDDCNLNEHIEGGSVSFRDPHKQIYLKMGSYALVIAATGSNPEDVFARKQIFNDSLEIYSCRSRSSYGSYRLQISSTVGDNPFKFTSIPPTVTINPKECQKSAKEICFDVED
ncbi:Trypsin-like cysteine/serine peptidase domain [Plasmopara halstedii]|uniref:Trypsin-like cysteine/serine peptidase domain n=1 Tax=Plasmopara halstedii TaxID=4781 RepID=A0A0P1AIC7_PLAHL|nr:Trypsin-like cysteine/serine peptidase domain [Plasmopara halstedii]CEG40782.1 Trypsin-like cysteine/serine peptidase domain [Plasmopara halstedii]|eukprot:XP_024577151.1 Trypsin-like cysteine/serine peptidase domain [Plasmopara halstedii]